MTIRAFAVIAGIACGAAVPIFLFGVTICLLFVVDVTAQQLGVGIE